MAEKTAVMFRLVMVAGVMDIETIRQYLDDGTATPEWLTAWGVVDLQRAHANFVAMADHVDHAMVI